MTGYRLSRHVYSDLDVIADYISQDDPARALSFIDEITARFETIAERPLSYPFFEDLPGEIRSALHGRYRIFFVMIEQIPHILRVVHGSRDLLSLLDDN